MTLTSQDFEDIEEIIVERVLNLKRSRKEYSDTSSPNVDFLAYQDAKIKRFESTLEKVRKM
jgi:hypothetical protein